MTDASRAFLALLFVMTAAPVASEDPATRDAVEASAVEAEKPAWTPELVMRYKPLSSTALSADGSRVAYVVRHAEMEGERSEFIQRIRVAATDGSSDVAYTRRDVSSTDPAFSPDGGFLAFLSKRGDEAKTQVWAMRVLGGEADQLTDAKSDVRAFRWSPDGRSIAYLMADPETEEEELAKKEKRDVLLVHQDFKYSHLYLAAAPGLDAGDETAEARRLTEGEFHVTGFDWSPDGESIVFSHRRDPLLNTGEVDGDLSTVQIADGEVEPLVTWGGVDDTPLVSPDGRLVAFRSDGEAPRPVGYADVYVVSIEGGEATRRRLAWTPDRDSDLLGWSADGEEVIATESRGTTRQLLAIPVDGGEPRYLSDVAGVLSSASLGHGGRRVAFVFQTSDVPPEVYVASLGDLDASRRRLSTIHEGLARPPMGQTRRLSWSSPDGLAIEGLLTTPVGYAQGRRVPLVLQIHGGPAGVHEERFTGLPGAYPTQVFAQAGYAILRPNPRGSTGYGKDFRFANVRDWGHGDYEDLMSGVDKAIELGVADPDQLYVMGWSYGGYMTSYLVTRTGRFRAASMGAGLSNLVSMVHTTDIADYLVAHMGAELWQDYEIYEKHSAIYRVDQITTPTQVIHGAEDVRVPFSQGEEFYRALRRRGVPTEMVVYPRTPHGPREPKFVMDVSQRILAWFDQHSGED